MTLETREQLEEKIASLENELAQIRVKASEQDEKIKAYDSDYKKIKKTLDDLRTRLYGKKNDLDKFLFGDEKEENEGDQKND